MRPPFYFRCLTLLIGLCGSAMAANASHLMGAELTYEYAGTIANPFQYRVVARLFSDQNSVITDPQLVLTCGRNECGTALTGSFLATLVEVNNVSNLTGCTNGGAAYRVSTLVALVQLPPARWTLSIDGSNRAIGIANVTQSGNQSTYVQALLDNSTSLVNSSPRFTTSQLIELAGAQDQRYSVNAFDSEGDSLVYQLVRPLATPTPAAPCGTPTLGLLAPHFQLNAATGELRTLAGPPQLGRYTLATRIDEFRRISGNWQLIGSITRDVTYFVMSGTNQVPAFTRVALSQAPTGQLLDQLIRVNPSQTVTLRLSAADPNAGQQLRLTSDLAAVVPGAALQDQGNGQGLLTWQVPATLPMGRYAFTTSAYDNNCPIQGGAVLTLRFLVTRDVLVTQTYQPLPETPFPIPFTDEVRFQLAGPGNAPVIVVDRLGRTVAQLISAPDGRVRWYPATSLAAGLYLARKVGGTQIARLLYNGR